MIEIYPSALYINTINERAISKVVALDGLLPLFVYRLVVFHHRVRKY